MVAIANCDGSLFCNVIADDSEYAMSPDGFNQVTIVSSFPSVMEHTGTPFADGD